jgi:hypothetical protein
MEEEEQLGVEKRTQTVFHDEGSTTNVLADDNKLDALQVSLVMECGRKPQFQEVWTMPVVQERLNSVAVAAPFDSQNTKIQTSKTVSQEHETPRARQYIKKTIEYADDTRAEWGKRSLRQLPTRRIPEDMRIRITGFNIDLNMQKIHLEYT